MFKDLCFLLMNEDNEFNVKFDISLIQFALMNRADIQHFVAPFLLHQFPIKTTQSVPLWELKLI